MILANHCQEWAYKLVYQIPLPLCFISFKLNSVNCSRLLLKGFIFSWCLVSVLGCCTVTELSAENGIKQRMCLKYPRWDWQHTIMPLHANWDVFWVSYVNQTQQFIPFTIWWIWFGNNNPSSRHWCFTTPTPTCMKCSKASGLAGTDSVVTNQLSL